MKYPSLKEIFFEGRDLTDFFEPHGLNDKQERVLDAILLAANEHRSWTMNRSYPGYRKMHRKLTSKMMGQAIEKYFGLPGIKTLSFIKKMSKPQATRYLISQMKKLK